MSFVAAAELTPELGETCATCAWYEGEAGTCTFPRTFTMDTAADESACDDWEEA